jgi:hypothetical protein
MTVFDEFDALNQRLLAQQLELWDQLPQHLQLDYFCAVTHKIAKAELHNQRSYRGVLYSEFGFGPEAYGLAQNAGFLELHNAIYSDGYEQRLLTELVDHVRTLGPVEDWPDTDTVVRGFLKR